MAADRGDLAEVAAVARPIVERVVWATIATVGPDGRPRTRLMHPVWWWDGPTSGSGSCASPPPPPARPSCDGEPTPDVAHHWAAPPSFQSAPVVRAQERMVAADHSPCLP
jgi:hypothetical protein